ncbi:hypothetical protein Tco_1571302 [Tanacetum coccineum]
MRNVTLNTLPCLDVVLKSFGCDHSSKTTDLTSIKFLCTVITKVQLLFAVTMSSTLDQSTSTYVTISSESKWKIEWLNSTSWKRTINLRTFSQKHYQENALSIENGSLFEGESEFDKLKIYLITLVSIRSDWEDLPWLFRSVENLNTMAEQNVPAQAPTRTDEQIVPRSQWLQIGKSNLLFDAQKIQKNPIFQISVDILRNTNFFRAFSASASVLAVYIQQFWNSMKYDEKTGVYCCQVDKQWFNLSADLFRKALDITPVGPAHPFELPPTGDMVIDFVNQLGYPEPVEFISNIRVNYVYQPWRAILTLINQCLTGKTSGIDKPRHPVLQMLWGIVTRTNVDHAELLWEEFTQGIQTFFSHKASHKASLKNPKKKAVPLLIPYGRFTKMIIYYLGSTSDVHKRPESPCHLPGDDFLLGNLKFISKGETSEVFGMAIPKQLITQAIQQSSYYPKYLEMVAKNTKKTPQDSASKQPEPATKRAPPKKPTTTTPVKPTKPPSSKQPKSPTKKPSKRKLPQKVRKGKPSFQLVDEDDEAQQESVPQGESDDPALELAKKMSLDAHQEKGEGEGADADIERAIKLSLDPSFLPQGQAPVGGVAIRDPVSETTPKLPEVVGKEQGEVASSTVTSGVGTYVRTEDQAGSNHGKAHEALVTTSTNQHGTLQLSLHPSRDHSIHRPSSIRNPANYHLYHALMEALIANEDAMDKEVKDRQKEKTTISGASGSAQPPLKDDEQSSKKPHDFDASASKQHPNSYLQLVAITDTRDAVIDSSMHNSKSESGHSEHSFDDVSKQDEGHISDLEDTDNTHIPKVKAATWFKPIQEDERTSYPPDQNGTIPRIDFPETKELLGICITPFVSSSRVVNKASKKRTYMIYVIHQMVCRRTGKKKLYKADLEGPAFNLVDLVNPEGHQILRNIYEPLPLGGPPGQVTIRPQFFFNKDLEYLLTGDKEQITALSISNLKKPLVTRLWSRRISSVSYGLKVNAIMTSVQLMVSHTGGSEERNFTSTNTSMEKLDQWLKTFTSVRVNMAWILGKWSRMTEEEQKTSFTADREKDYRSGGSFEVWKALLEEE